MEQSHETSAPRTVSTKEGMGGCEAALEVDAEIERVWD